MKFCTFLQFWYNAYWYAGVRIDTPTSRYNIPLLTRTGTRYRHIGTNSCVSVWKLAIGIDSWNQDKECIGTEFPVSVRVYRYAHVRLGTQSHFWLFYYLNMFEWSQKPLKSILQVVWTLKPFWKHFKLVQNIFHIIISKQISQQSPSFWYNKTNLKNCFDSPLYKISFE